MSVLKSKRKPSQFEVFHHLNKMRKEVTDLLLRDFGYDLDKAVKKVETTFGGRPYEELSPDEKVRYEKLMVFIQQMEWADGTFYLAFREKTKEEKLVAALNTTSDSVTDVQVALAEVYEMVLGGK